MSLNVNGWHAKVAVDFWNRLSDRQQRLYQIGVLTGLENCQDEAADEECRVEEEPMLTLTISHLPCTVRRDWYLNQLNSRGRQMFEDSFQAGVKAFRKSLGVDDDDNHQQLPSSSSSSSLAAAFILLTVDGWQTKVSEAFWHRETTEEDKTHWKMGFLAGVRAAEWERVEWWKGLSSREQGIYACGYDAGQEEYAKAKAASHHPQVQGTTPAADDEQEIVTIMVDGWTRAVGASWWNSLKDREQARFFDGFEAAIAEATAEEASVDEKNAAEEASKRRKTDTDDAALA